MSACVRSVSTMPLRGGQLVEDVDAFLGGGIGAGLARDQPEQADAQAADLLDAPRLAERLLRRAIDGIGEQDRVLGRPQELLQLGAACC